MNKKSPTWDDSIERSKMFYNYDLDKYRHKVPIDLLATITKRFVVGDLVYIKDWYFECEDIFSLPINYKIVDIIFYMVDDNPYCDITLVDENGKVKSEMAEDELSANYKKVLNGYYDYLTITGDEIKYRKELLKVCLN